MSDPKHFDTALELVEALNNDWWPTLAHFSHPGHVPELANIAFRAILELKQEVETLQAKIKKLEK